MKRIHKILKIDTWHKLPLFEYLGYIWWGSFLEYCLRAGEDYYNWKQNKIKLEFRGSLLARSLYSHNIQRGPGAWATFREMSRSDLEVWLFFLLEVNQNMQMKYLTLIYPAHFEDVPCQSGVNHIFEG